MKYEVQREFSRGVKKYEVGALISLDEVDAKPLLLAGLIKKPQPRRKNQAAESGD